MAVVAGSGPLTRPFSSPNFAHSYTRHTGRHHTLISSKRRGTYASSGDGLREMRLADFKAEVTENLRHNWLYLYDRSRVHKRRAMLSPCAHLDRLAIVVFTCADDEALIPLCYRLRVG